MYPTKDARELWTLLRISREVDVVGDLSATVDNPSELIAWAALLDNAVVAAWRGHDSGHRYLQVTAEHHRSPVHGRVTAVLPCEQHEAFWRELDLSELEPGESRAVPPAALFEAWSRMPLTPSLLDTVESSRPASAIEASGQVDG